MASGKARLHSDVMTAFHDAEIAIYLRQIAKTSPLTSGQEAELAALIRAGDSNAFTKLVLANLRFVVSVAHAYMNQGLPVNDLINVGNIGLMRAAKRFDGKKNFRFISYAVWWIRQAILQALADQSRIVRLPINRAASLYKIDKTQRKLQQRNLRAVTPKEIADELGISERDVCKMMQVAARHSSFDAPAEDGKTTLYDKIPDDSGGAADLLADISLSREIRKSLSVLDEREREVVFLYFGIGCETSCTLSEIGLRYGLTRERVRQIKENAIKKLKKPACHARLRDFYLQP